MHLLTMTTRGQEGPACCHRGVRWSQSAGSLLGRGAALLFTTLAFDQLLFSQQPAGGQTGAQLPAGSGEGMLPSYPFSVPQRQARLSPGDWVHIPSPACLHITSSHALMTLDAGRVGGIMPLTPAMETRPREVK